MRRANVERHVCALNPRRRHGLPPTHPSLPPRRLCLSREGEVARRQEHRAAAVCHRVEAVYAGRIARLDKLASRFLLTTASPPLYWCPGKQPCPQLDAEAERQRQAHEQRKEALRQELEEEKASIVQVGRGDGLLEGGWCGRGPAAGGPPHATSSARCRPSPVPAVDSPILPPSRPCCAALPA